jgi:virulence-associated protein VapD
MLEDNRALLTTYSVEKFRFKRAKGSLYLTIKSFNGDYFFYEISNLKGAQNITSIVNSIIQLYSNLKGYNYNVSEIINE